MYTQLPLSLVYLLLLPSRMSVSAVKLPGIVNNASSRRAGLSSLLPLSWGSPSNRVEKRGNFEYDNNGTSFLWIIEDTYSGQTFFDRFEFYDQSDPTHGTVNYVNQTAAFSQGLAYVTDDNKVIMSGDNTTWLPAGAYRDSVRVSSMAQYNTGLFVLDVDRAPWGCGVWPAFWTVGSGQWPATGEIDIVEGVHDNQHNQVTWHSGPGCNLTATANFTGTIVQTNGVDNLDCDGNANYNAGCGITEWSRASYGPTFDAQGGGVFAMKWDEEGIAVWSFYRASIPQDIVEGEPDPSGWGTPVAALAPSGCNPITNFVNHSIIFDITFCGDWAGNSYATSGCPGTCADHIQDPSNFVNASWIINTLKVYKKQDVGQITNGAMLHTPLQVPVMPWLFWLVFVLSLGLFGW